VANKAKARAARSADGGDSPAAANFTSPAPISTPNAAVGADAGGEDAPSAARSTAPPPPRAALSPMTGKKLNSARRDGFIH